MKERIKKLGLVLVGALLVLALPPALALAQEVIIQGVDSSDVVRRAKVDANGNLITTTSTSTPSGAASGTHGACTNQAQTITGTAANVPTTPRADRVTLMICNSESGETISCEFDGSDAVLATGQELGNLDCVVVNLAGTVNASCISDGTSVDARIMECP